MKLQLLEAKVYLTHLQTTIPKAQHRIALTAMNGNWGKRTSKLYELLLQARRRGVDVQLVFDVFSKLPITERVSYLEFRRRSKAMGQMVERLRAAGATVTYAQKIGVNPYKGRTHVKATVIDDTVYSFGGVNLQNGAFENADYMFMATDHTLASKMIEIISEIGQATPQSDLELPITPQTTLLYDAGAPKQSIIYDTACKLAADSRKMYYVSQMAPSGRLAGHMRKVPHQSYFNRPAQMSFPASFGEFIDQRRGRLRNLYKGKKYIHAKFILFELKDGAKALVSGSNNYSWRGVAYGTKEIAIASTDEVLWQQLYAFLEAHIA